MDIVYDRGAAGRIRKHRREQRHIQPDCHATAVAPALTDDLRSDVFRAQRDVGIGYGGAVIAPVVGVCCRHPPRLACTGAIRRWHGALAAGRWTYRHIPTRPTRSARSRSWRSLWQEVRARSPDRRWDAPSSRVAPPALVEWAYEHCCATAPCRDGARNDPGRSARDPNPRRQGARDLDGYHAAGAYEWMCLVASALHLQTRERRLERTRSQLSRGQRRPCCWEG
jgi:hypothetical protein